MVDGFSQSSKCSPEGRALMNMDYQQVMHNIEKVSKTRVSQKQKAFAENFIRAYYLSENELEKVNNLCDYSFVFKNIINMSTNIVYVLYTV